MKIGLRIDVDTFRGTKYGVPNLCELLGDHSINASFFFSVGPDNMGRHLWRLLRPAFLRKMLKTKAASLYGWDIIFRGTFWPGPIIGDKLDCVIKAADDAGHEIGLHAWDHHAWQAHIDEMDGAHINNSISKGIEALAKITNKPLSSATPGWKCNDLVLTEKNKFNFTYNSDCRGTSIFYPIVNQEVLSQPQIPVTLPTYDEIVGQTEISATDYNDYILSLLNPHKLNVLTIHAEVEGILLHDMFNDFIKKAKAKNWTFVPLKSLLQDSNPVSAKIVKKTIPNREGWLASQE